MILHLHHVSVSLRLAASPSPHLVPSHNVAKDPNVADIRIEHGPQVDSSPRKTLKVAWAKLVIRQLVISVSVRSR